jgi:hypothetical protein
MPPLGQKDLAVARATFARIGASHKPSKAMIAGAAVAGLLTGSFAVRAYTASASGHAGVSIQTMADAEKGKHACKGQNECKGQGGCKTSDAMCKAKNSCKGKGGCATDGTKPPQL